MSPSRRNLIVLVVVLVGLACAIVYNVKAGREQQLQPRRVTAFDMNADWRCLECGHSLTDKAAVGPRPCPECGQETMYVTQQWGCLEHGVMSVAFQYDEKAKPAKVKVGNGDWVSALDEEGDVSLRCPVCGEPLVIPQALPPP
jgi:predicted RNA-binding Zn-ribbon protein involved in translation (DUF1610 family)